MEVAQQVEIGVYHTDYEASKAREFWLSVGEGSVYLSRAQLKQFKKLINEALADNQ